MKRSETFLKKRGGLSWLYDLSGTISIWLRDLFLLYVIFVKKIQNCSVKTLLRSKKETCPCRLLPLIFISASGENRCFYSPFFWDGQILGFGI